MIQVTVTLRRVRTSVVAVVVLLTLGAGLAYGLDAGLRLSATPAAVAPEPPPAVAAPGTAPPPRIGSVALPSDDRRLTAAAKAVTDVLDGAGPPSPGRWRRTWSASSAASPTPGSGRSTRPGSPSSSSGCRSSAA